MVEEARLESSYTSKAYQGSNPLLSANDRVVGWVANIRLQPFIFGVDKFVRNGLKIKVGRMAGRRKSGVRKVASGPTEEGRAACGNAKSSALCRRVEPGRNVVRKHSFCLCNAAKSFEWAAAIEWPIRFCFGTFVPSGRIGERCFVKLIRNP